MKLIFDDRFLRHINEASLKEHGRSSAVLLFAEKLFKNRLFVFFLGSFEYIASFIMNLRIPVYSSIMYYWITNSRGLPYMGGMYLRGLYYRGRLKKMEPNVFIDQNVFFAFPAGVELQEFCYIDKYVTIMSRSAKFGRRVHVAPRVFISGGGDFEIENYACIATNSNMITSTEVIKNGARCSGPMVSADQRNVMRGKILIEKDAFIGPNVTILPDVVVATGSVVAAGCTLSKSTDPWGIYISGKTSKVSDRSPVIFPDN